MRLILIEAIHPGEEKRLDRSKFVRLSSVWSIEFKMFVDDDEALSLVDTKFVLIQQTKKAQHHETLIDIVFRSVAYNRKNVLLDTIIYLFQFVGVDIDGLEQSHAPIFVSSLL
jgi:hypothetical protein